MKTARNEVEEAAPVAAQTTIKFHRLIYAMGPDRVMTPMASGLLLRTGPRRFLVTAAHVLDSNSTGPGECSDLVTYGRGKGIVLRGESFRTAIVDGKTRNEDLLDIGFALLNAESADQMGEDRFLSPADCDPNATGRSPALYGALGYPACLNEDVGPDTQGTANPKPFLYTSPLHPASAYRRMGVSPLTHLLLDVSRRKTTGPGGRKVKLPDLRGMSGGGLWRLGEYSPGPRITAPRLLGVVTERRWGHGGGLLAARIGLVFEALRKVYPEFDGLLPRTALASITVEVVPA